MDGDKRTLSIVVPVYNAQDNLTQLVETLVGVFSNSAYNYEIVLVNDGSSDRSWAALCALQSHYPERLCIVDLMRNYGQHNALMCGLRECTGDIVVTMDDDLQHAPNDALRLVEALEQGNYDLVYGVYRKKRHEPWRNAGSALIQLFYRRIFSRRNNITAFRAIRRQLVESIFPYTLNYVFLDGLFAWSSDRIGEVEVDHEARQQGRSGYSLSKLVTLAINLFTNFSLVPLQIVSWLGLIFSVGGFFMGCYYLFLHFANSISVPGYASIIVSVSIFGGIQLLALGVVGEYLGRVHLNINRMPQYNVRQKRPVHRKNDL
ncbi:MAG: glycosyltransferase family 2 protein [Magnetococcales bacterium]|nr:glycosyltransferase family 2 protein [Magnetococcales bacterium]